ncbi:MAG: amino acid ABC transporter substrate-binding protein [Desulfobacteraceae bacterium]|jgi:ABC-type amino acid transport substrate-binding protein|nr:amino acid ABC transporter substrate-binding protein [Desulfobacteraceae bacterium]
MKGKLGIILLIVIFASPLSAKELTGTLQQVKKSGQIRIGYRVSAPPMSFSDKDGNPAGYSIDICKGIVAELENKIGADVKVEYIPVSADGRFKALIDNKIDILCGSTTKTLSRSELVDFTQLTFVTGASLMTLKDDKADDSDGFDGKKIGVVKATTTAVALKKLFQDTSTDAEVVLFDSAKEGIEALRKKKIDAFSSDQVVLIGIITKVDDPKNYVISSSVFSFEPFALAVRRNDSDFRLVADRVISDLYRSEKILDIYDKWIGEYTQQRPPIFDAMMRLNATPE